MTLFLFITSMVCSVFVIVGAFFLCVKCVGQPKRIDHSRLLLVVGVVFSCLVAADSVILGGFVWVANHPDGEHIYLDCHPFPGMVSFTLNFIVPLMVAALLLNICVARNQLRKLPGLVGAILSLLSIAGSICIGYYLFAKYLGRSFTETVWWL